MKERHLVERFWSATPWRALVPLLLAVFFTFATIGFLLDIGRVGRMERRALAAIVVFSGLVAVAIALIVIRRRYWLFAPTVLVQVLVSRWLDRLWPEAGSALPGEALRFRLALDAGGTLLGLALGYSFFMMFIVRQGLGRARAEAEMALAREIHVSLVPEVALETAWCDMHGRSIPASEVGGDLVDAVVAHGRPVGMVADVSGHGVPAGTLMGLLKASVRTRLRGGFDLGELAADVNDVVAELTRPNTFATAALLALESPTRLAYVLAGHPPILHRRQADRAVVRHGEGGLALGIRPGERYPVASAEVAPGDVLAVLTDGFTETMDAEERELGLEPLERLLAAHGDEPLPRLFERLLGAARAHGEQTDDRTLLLVRVRAA